jgi:hypothetical protein
MTIRLEEDKRTLDSAETLLAGLAKAGVTFEQVSAVKVPLEVEKLFNAFTRTAYRNQELAESIEGFTFWGLLEWALSRDYGKWVAKPDRDSATEFLRIISHNLQRETKPKLLIVPIRKTIVESPMRIDPFLIVPRQETEKEFVSTLESFGLKPAKIREELFEHMAVTTGYNLTLRPLVIMYTEKDQYTLEDQFHDTFVQKVLPLLRVFDAQFPLEGPRPTMEVMSGGLSERVFASVVFDLHSGEMRRQGLERLGGELSTGLNLSHDRLKEFRERGFEKIRTWLYTSRGTLSGRIRNALTFFNRARDAEIQREYLSAFIFSVIALESLFSRDVGVPLRATLADSVALLTESKVETRLVASRRIKKIYDCRSGIVHAGNDNVAQDDLRDSMRFCARSLFELLTHASNWGDVADTVLFEEIDRRKFG